MNAARPWPRRRTSASTQLRGLADQLARLLRPSGARARRASARRATSSWRDQALHARRVRRLVDAEQRRQLARLEQARDRLVGGDHQELDQPVRLGLLGRQQALDVALARERRTRARWTRRPARRARSRASASACATLRAAASGRRPRLPRRARPRRRSGPRAGSRAARRSGSPSGGTPSAARVAPSNSSSTVTASRSSPGHQRARAVRQRLGQHRLHQPGHVDRVRAPERLAVERRPGPHERATRRRCAPTRGSRRRAAPRPRSRRRSPSPSAGRS